MWEDWWARGQIPEQSILNNALLPNLFASQWLCNDTFRITTSEATGRPQSRCTGLRALPSPVLQEEKRTAKLQPAGLITSR